MTEKKIIPKTSERIQPKKRRSKLEIFIGVIVFILIFSLVNYESSQGSYASSININGIDYHYYNPQTNTNWTYFVPGNYNMASGSSISDTSPFTSNLNCSMIFTNVYSLTPGFTVQVQDLPLTFYPATPTDMNMTIIAPSHPFSGSLNVGIWVNYTC